MTDYLGDAVREAMHAAALRALYAARVTVPRSTLLDAPDVGQLFGDPDACEHEPAEIVTFGGEVVRRYCNLCGERLLSTAPPPPATWYEPPFVATFPLRYP